MAKHKYIEDSNYIVFSDGVVSNQKNQKALKPYLNKGGYYVLKLSIGGRCVNESIHRLIAKAFIPNPENKEQVNHINGIKTDNRIENLEWCTQQENLKHAWDNNLRNNKLFKLNSNKIKRIILNTNVGVFYNSVTEASKEIGLSKQYLCNMLSGKQKNKTGLIYA